MVEALRNFIMHTSCKGACPHESCVLSVLRGIRNGAVYGAKIRAPHALVMTMLWRPGSLHDKLYEILMATYTHSKNLATFVGIYKSIVCALRHVTGSDNGAIALIAGAIGGVAVFGEYNAINSQINMYILSRIIMGSVRAAINNGYLTEYQYAYQIYAGVCWALVMYLFHFQKGTLQPSLISSMTYLYLDSNTWPNTNENGIIEWLMK